MKPDAEHQQDNANFGKLRNEVLIGHKTGCMRASNDTGEQIADEEIS